MNVDPAGSAGSAKTKDPTGMTAGFMPTFRDQRRVFDALKELVQRALREVGADEPDPVILDELVEKQFVALVREFGAADTVRQTPLASHPETTSPALSPPRSDEAAAAVWFAQLHGISSIPDALAWFLAHRKKTAAAPPLRQCVEEFLRAKRLEGRAPRTLHAYGKRLALFDAKFGERQPATVTPNDLVQYFSQWREPGALGGHWDVLSVFFNWLVVKSLVFENPVPLALRRPQQREAARLIYTPEEAAEILRKVKHTDEAGFWALSLFAGLRTHEIKRLNALPDPWALIDLRRGVIDLSGSKIVSGRRVIPISVCLAAWLRWVRARGLRFMPSNPWPKFRRVRAIALAARYQDDNHATAGGHGRSIDGKKVYAMARRSYMSYRVALDGASYVELTDEVGTSEVFLRTKFYRKASRADALRYFALSPSIVGSNDTMPDAESARHQG